MSANLANGDATVENELMNEVDWDGDMLDSRSDCICVENVDARLAVDVEWHWTDAWRGKAKEGCDVLGVDGTLGSSKCATSLAVSGMKSNDATLSLLPIKCTTTEEKEDTFDGAACLVVASMIAIDEANHAIRELHRLKLGRIKINTQCMISINDPSRVDDGPVRMGSEETNGAIETSERSSRRPLGVSTESCKAETKLRATPNIHMHQLAQNFRECTTVTLDEFRKLSLVGWEIFKELDFIGGVSAKGSVNSLETAGSGGWKELVDDGFENVRRLIE